MDKLPRHDLSLYCCSPLMHAVNCRVGGRDRFFHCHTCGCCYAVELRNNHRCIQGSMHQNCPVCQENLFNSTSECRVLRCGHTMHRDCLRALVASISNIFFLYFTYCPTFVLSFSPSLPHSISPLSLNEVKKSGQQLEHALNEPH